MLAKESRGDTEHYQVRPTIKVKRYRPVLTRSTRFQSAVKGGTNFKIALNVTLHERLSGSTDIDEFKTLLKAVGKQEYGRTVVHPEIKYATL